MSDVDKEDKMRLPYSVVAILPGARFSEYITVANFGSHQESIDFIESSEFEDLPDGTLLHIYMKKYYIKRDPRYKLIDSYGNDPMSEAEDITSGRPISKMSSRHFEYYRVINGEAIPLDGVKFDRVKHNAGMPDSPVDRDENFYREWGLWKKKISAIDENSRSKFGKRWENKWDEMLEGEK